MLEIKIRGLYDTLFAIHFKLRAQKSLNTVIFENQFLHEVRKMPKSVKYYLKGP
jgi:hypothetical protein